MQRNQRRFAVQTFPVWRVCSTLARTVPFGSGLVSCATSFTLKGDQFTNPARRALVRALNHPCVAVDRKSKGYTQPGPLHGREFALPLSLPAR